MWRLYGSMFMDMSFRVSLHALQECVLQGHGVYTCCCNIIRFYSWVDLRRLSISLHELIK